VDEQAVESALVYAQKHADRSALTQAVNQVCEKLLLSGPVEQPEHLVELYTFLVYWCGRESFYTKEQSTVSRDFDRLQVAAAAGDWFRARAAADASGKTLVPLVALLAYRSELGMALDLKRPHLYEWVLEEYQLLYNARVTYGEYGVVKCISQLDHFGAGAIAQGLSRTFGACADAATSKQTKLQNAQKAVAAAELASMHFAIDNAAKSKDPEQLAELPRLRAGLANLEGLLQLDGEVSLTILREAMSSAESIHNRNKGTLNAAKERSQAYERLGAHSEAMRIAAAASRTAHEGHGSLAHERDAFNALAAAHEAVAQERSGAAALVSRVAALATREAAERLRDAQVN
jgi:hypothetical protein